MSLLRAFIAIEIPLEIHKPIERITTRMRERLPSSFVRWVPINNIHLTLKFLGAISATKVDLLAQVLSTEVNRHKSFEIQCGELGIFPNPIRPRVVWIGIQAPAELEALQNGIEAATAKLGYSAERRPFSAHLTIGRVKKNLVSAGSQKIRTLVEETKVGSLGSVRVTGVHLFKSDLRPGGAIYTELHSAPLGK